MKDEHCENCHCIESKENLILLHCGALLCTACVEDRAEASVRLREGKRDGRESNR
jgi:hypothetical protein